MYSKDRFLSAAKREDVDRPPVWIMRQAGRTLPEYRHLREKYSFWDLCRNPELAAEVTLQPLKRFSLDAAVIFSDILVIPDALGMNVSFSPKLSLSPVITGKKDLQNLKTKDFLLRLEYVAETIRSVNLSIKKTAVLGFSGAPFTLSRYMIEGKSTGKNSKAKEWMFRHPDLFLELQEILSSVISEYLIFQAEASATAVQLFDTWAGELHPEDYRKFVQPFIRRIIQTVKKRTSIPVIYYINGAAGHLDAVFATGADVLSVDWRISLSKIRKRLGTETVLQGNLDPALLFSPPEVIRERVHRLIQETAGKGHIVNLGHGLNPETPLSGIEAFVQSVIEWKK